MPAIPLLPNHSPTLISPGRRMFAITPSNSAELPFPTKAIYVGTAGTVVCVNAAGDEVSWLMQPGSYIDAEIIQVKATGTTATDMIGIAG